jgi:two-component system cell cycle sensor histidine kinase/response regulator CckA
VLREGVKKIDADPNQIEQIIMNMALNARDAMPEGGRLIFETENVLLDEGYINREPGVVLGEYVLLSISDTGWGIEKEALRYIFDPFFTTKEIGKGTGLGLAIVYGIVKNHGGHISCYSEKGKGTTFRIYFPVSKADGGRQIRMRSRKWAIRGGSETILVVEDEKDILEQEQVMLSEYGYKVLTAESGEEALKVFSESSPELVILDLNMPGMGGHQCLQELLKLDPEARVIVASGYSSELVPKDVLESGARAIINKPFLWEDILGKVRELLDVGRSPPGRW